MIELHPNITMDSTSNQLLLERVINLDICKFHLRIVKNNISKVVAQDIVIFHLSSNRVLAVLIQRKVKCSILEDNQVQINHK